MTVYVDVLFVTNLIINYLLLFITSLLAKTAHRRLRFFLASAVGGLYCVFTFIFSLDTFLDAIFKILMTLIISLIAFRYISISHFIRCTVLLIASGLLFGGLLYGIYFLFHPNTMYLNNSVYFHVSPILLIACITISYMILLIFTYFFTPQAISANYTYTVTISLHGKSISAEGFVDTGNGLMDIFTNSPVILCSYSIVEHILTNEEKAFFISNFKCNEVSDFPKGIRVIPLTTVSGTKVLPAFKPDSVVLENQDFKKYIEKSLIAVFNEDEYLNERKVILNPEIMIQK